MATKTAPTTKIDPPIGVAFDANTGKAVTLGMDVYPAGWTVYEANAQWHLGYLGDLSKVWRDYTGKGVSVGVYDQGVESAHWDLAANIDKSKELVDDNGNVLSGEPVFTSDDLHDGAHGTSCAGLIAAARNGRGGVGVAYDAKITSVNIFDGNSQASDLNWVIGKGSGFDVIARITAPGEPCRASKRRAPPRETLESRCSQSRRSSGLITASIAWASSRSVGARPSFNVVVVTTCRESLRIVGLSQPSSARALRSSSRSSRGV